MANNVGTKSEPDHTIGGPGTFSSPDPTGLDHPPTPLQSGPKPNPAPPPQPPQGIELNLVASYPNPWQGNPAKEKALAAAGTWFPHTADFKGVAGAGSTEIPSAWALVLQIFKATQSIKRLNFFSHGKAGVISFKGTVDPAGTDVTFAGDFDAAFGQIFGQPKAIVDPYAKDQQQNDVWGNFGQFSSKKITIDSTSLSLDDVRAKFTSDAVIWLYLCHGASDPLLQQQVANAFQVTVKGFNGTMVFCVQPGFPQNRKHKVAIQTQSTSGDPCANAVADFHQLDNDPSVRTSTPKKP